VEEPNKEIIKELYMNDDTQYVFLDGFDKAIIGVEYDKQVVYSYDKIIEILMENFKNVDEEPTGMEYEEAVEFYDFNIERALDYMGEHKPIIIYTI